MINLALRIDSKEFNLNETQVSSGVAQVLASTDKIEGCVSRRFFVERTIFSRSLIKDLIFPIAQYRDTKWEISKDHLLDLLTLVFRVVTLIPKILYDRYTMTADQRETLDWLRNLGLGENLRDMRIVCAKLDSNAGQFTLFNHMSQKTKTVALNTVYANAYKIACNKAKRINASRNPHEINPNLCDSRFGEKAMQGKFPHDLTESEQIKAIFTAERKVHFNERPEVREIPRIGDRKAPDRGGSTLRLAH